MMKQMILAFGISTIVALSGCSKKEESPAQPLFVAPTAPEAAPASTPAPVDNSNHAPSTPALAEGPISPDALEEMTHLPCPFGLADSHEVQDFADLGMKVTFACDALKSESHYSDWKKARESYPKALALLAKNRTQLTKMKRPPQIIELDFLGEPSARLMSEENKLTLRLKINLTQPEVSVEKNLEFFLAADQSFGAYEIKNFSKLLLEVEGYLRDDLMTKPMAERKFRAVKDVLDANRSELNTLAERGLKSLCFDADYKLELRPHRLTLKNADTIAATKAFISGFPLRSFYSQKPNFKINLYAGSGLALRQDYSSSTAILFTKAIPEFIATVQALKNTKVEEMQFYMLPGEAATKRNNQILFYHGKLTVHMVRPDGIYPAEVATVLKQIKSLDSLKLE